jgi:polyisoprenoid-binding protein YceI
VRVWLGMFRPGCVSAHMRALTTALVCCVLSACAAGAATQEAPAQPAPAGEPSPVSNSEPSGATTALVLDPAASKASYHAHEQLVGRNLPSEAVGTSSAVSGSIVLGPNGSIPADQSRVSVDLRQLASDESRRDNFIKGNTLETNRYPTATFVPRQSAGLTTPLPSSGQATFELSGDLTVHGVTRPVTWQVSADFGEGDVRGDATTQVNISDFGMSPPKAGPVLSIQDGLTLEVAFHASRSP